MILISDSTASYIWGLLTADRQQLLDRVEKEVIGPDEILRGRRTTAYSVQLDASNDTREEQRTALAKLRKDLG